jgi:uncharacterized membrane protein
METISAAVEVHAPAHEAYEQWHRLEDFPRFVWGLEEVRHLDARRIRWRAEALGHAVEWEAEITQQMPDRLIAWKSIAGVRNSGFVSFEPLSATDTRVAVQVDYDPHGLVPDVVPTADAATMRLHTELEHFKIFLETHGQDAGP